MIFWLLLLLARTAFCAVKLIEPQLLHTLNGMWNILSLNILHIAHMHNKPCISSSCFLSLSLFQQLWFVSKMRIFCISVSFTLCFHSEWFHFSHCEVELCWFAKATFLGWEFTLIDSSCILVIAWHLGKFVSLPCYFIKCVYEYPLWSVLSRHHVSSYVPNLFSFHNFLFFFYAVIVLCKKELPNQIIIYIDWFIWLYLCCMCYFCFYYLCLWALLV